MVGTPSTVRPMGCHWPSPGVGVETNGTMAAGAGRWAGAVATGTVESGDDDVGFGMAPAAGLPPLGGACQVYQVFSAQVTMPPPPWSRTHSVSRLPGVGPRAGLVAAWPIDAQTGDSRIINTTKIVVFGWRPTGVGRSRMRCLRRARRSRRVGLDTAWARRGASAGIRRGMDSTTGRPEAPTIGSSWS